MGLLDRIGKIATGFGGAIQAPFGLVYDMARAPFVDEDELDGFVNVAYGRTVARGGQLFGNLLGPEEGVGAGIGALPGAVRAPIRTALDPVLKGLETAGREGIREPLTAGLTAASLMSAGKGFDLGEGYRIAQKRSLGQAFALAILTEDITDEAEVAEAMGTDSYQALSGTMDGVARLFLEPDVLISGGLSAARRAGTASRTAQALTKVPGAAGLVEKGVFGRSIRTSKDVEAALVHPALGRINEQIDALKVEEGVIPAAVDGAETAATVWPGRTNRATQMADELYDELGHDAAADLINTQRGVSPESVRDSLRNAVATGQVNVGGREVPRLRSLTDQLDIEDPKRITEGAAAAPAAKDPVAVDRVAARIRDLAFHDHRDGAIISRVLAESDDLPTAWGALMGHRDSVERLFAAQPELAGRISRLSGDQARIAEMKRMTGELGPDQLPLELPDSVKAIEANQINAELDQLYDVESKLLYHEQAVGMVRELPRISASSERRAAFTRSAFYQSSPMAAPLRVAINMRPRNFVDLHDAAGDAQVNRLLRKSRMDAAEQDRLRGAYMAAPDPGARNRILGEVEAASIRTVAARHGITDPAEIERLINTAAESRTRTMSSLGKSRKYDGAGRSYIEDIGDDGVTQRVYLPVAATQEVNQFILPDLDAIDKVLGRHGADISRVGVALAGGGEALQAFQRLWKPSVLMRVGWPIRVVGEEQIRIMSQMGALLTAGRTAKAGGRYLWDRQVIERIENATQAAKRIPKDQRSFRGGLSREEAASRRGLRLGTIEHRGVKAESAFGTNETFNDVYRTLNSARSSFEHVVQNADDIRNGLRTEVMGEWQSLEPSMRGYNEAWEHAVNNQIGKDPMWRQFVEGKSIDEVADWLGSADGRAYLRRMKHWRGREEQWLDVAKQTVDDYLPTDELRVLALEGKARATHLEQIIPDAAGRPVVHGAMLADINGKTRFSMAVGKLRDQAMKTLGTIPTDVLSRQPFFDHHYTQEVTRQIDLAIDQGMDITPEMMTKMEGKARNFALGESKRLLYDLADESELSHMLRFVSPFYSAWQEVLTRWVGIAQQNPAFVARLHEVWRAPERMGIVTDENGATVHEDGTATSVLGEKVEAGRDKFVNFKLLATDNAAGKAIFNDLTKNIPGVKRLESAKFNKKGANLILQGAPGVGPIVQIPVNELAKGRPELEDSLRWALPFGATQSTMQMLLPATARRAQTMSRGEEDRLYRNQLLRIYWDEQVSYNLNKRAEPPTYAEAKKKTDAFFKMRTVASFVSPVAPSFQSPYQMHIDIYRALKEKDPETADEIFLADYGDEFFPLTQSLSKTMDGIPPTLEGAAARKKYQDMIERHPELGGLIVGAEGAGEFSSAVYQSQLQQSLAPGSADKQRQAFSFEEATAKPNERLGWIEYSKAMDLIDAERMNRGLPNLQVRQAQDLANLKRAVIANLENKYPEWAEKFNITDRGAWGKRIAGMRDIAADGRLAGRPEIQGLGQYLETRDQVIGILAARKAAGGASTLNAASNMDIKGVWDQITGKMTQNPAFASLFYRYLERDPLALDTGPATSGVP